MTTPSDDDKLIERRKADHIRINLEENVQFPRLTTGLEQYRFPHTALPELDLDEVDTTITIFGKRLSAPLLISSMTGGTGEAGPINRALAEAAQATKIAMGLGSQRAAIAQKSLAATFYIRDIAPDVLLFANVGAVQLNYGFGVDEYRRAVDMAGADALILHFNALQEAVQPEGDGNFKNLLPRIALLCQKVGVPVIAKEVGWGFSAHDARRLTEAGVAAIDVAGAGGTSWSEVEYHRAPTDFHRRIARAFADWGIPTAESIKQVKSAAPQTLIMASGGLRDGIDVTKCLALGASLGGLAGPYLKAANQGVDAVIDLTRALTREIQIAMFMCGAKDITALQQVPLIQAD
ncbi:MAG: type 2 isopentenyl-diphosphate Delta-isomerase [Anaerolinea sp.]|nr:type 2 isopentenyl-diphosphate Delta-isomerase [Anaerolinea sp.]